ARRGGGGAPTKAGGRLGGPGGGWAIAPRRSDRLRGQDWRGKRCRLGDRRAGSWAPGPGRSLVLMPSATVRGVGDRAEQALARRVAEFEVLGPWALQTSRRFWEGFAPAARAGGSGGRGARTAVWSEWGLDRARG